MSTDIQLPFNNNDSSNLKRKQECSTNSTGECGHAAKRIAALPIDAPLSQATRLVNTDLCGRDPYHPTSVPLYQCATFVQPAADKCGEYDYTRSGNPTRAAAEQVCAELEGGHSAYCFSSGMAALSAVTKLVQCGDEIIAGEDIYGGLYRLLSAVVSKLGVSVTFVDTTKLELVERAFSSRTKLVMIESPTNPQMQITDIKGLSAICHRHGALLSVDNTMMSPVLQNPISLGADLVVHSATKWLSGHSDVTAGVVVAAREDVGKRIYFVQNAEGTGLAPFDCWLLLRGIKTLHVRLEAAQRATNQLVTFLQSQPGVTEVLYPGLVSKGTVEEKAAAAAHFNQCRGGGAVISFRTHNVELSKCIVNETKLFKTTVSFGSTASVIELPCILSHASIPEEIRQLRDFPTDLVRIGVGLESPDDLIRDLSRAFQSYQGLANTSPVASKAAASLLSHQLPTNLPLEAETESESEGTDGPSTPSSPEHQLTVGSHHPKPQPLVTQHAAQNPKVPAAGVKESKAPSQTWSRQSTPVQASSLSTVSVQAGETARERPTFEGSLTVPIACTSTFSFESTDQVIEYNERNASGRYEYGRYGNPTTAAVEEKLRQLEGAEASLVSASGMASATTMLLALCEPNKKIVTTTDCYRRTRQFIQTFLVKLGVEAVVVDPSDLAAVETAMAGGDVSLFFSESPTNPYLRCVDVEALSLICHKYGALCCIDSTFATPINQRPISQGADVVIHSATKYLAGHNDVLCGCLSGKKEIVAKVRSLHGVLGGVIDPHAAYLLLRGLKTLKLRVTQQNQTGAALATLLENHPAVEKVYYPGLPSHPDHQVAKRQMTGFGGVVSFIVKGEFEGAKNAIDAMKIPRIAPSLGGVESLVEQPTVMSFWNLTKEQREAVGIKDGLVRYSCGIEDTEDLLEDVKQALDALI